MSSNEDARRRVAAKLQVAMSELGMTTIDLAKLLKVDCRYAHQVCNIGISPMSRYFRQLCDEFGFDPDEFGFEKKKPVKKRPLEDRPELEKKQPRQMTPETYGAIFANARRAQKLTLKVVADYTGCSWVTLERIERGHAIPQPRTVTELCRVLGLSEAEMQKKRAAALAGAAAQRRVRPDAGLTPDYSTEGETND